MGPDACVLARFDKWKGITQMAKAKPAAAKPKAATPTKPAAAAKSAASPKPAKVELVTLRQLAAAIGEAHGLSQTQANGVLSSTVTLIREHLKKGARIRIAGLGTLEVRKRAARMGRNPATGEPIEIKASKKIAFRAAKDLSEAI
jgi:DNA-binding protein HU-beta